MRKRFIAGATCPQCGQVDKIYIIAGAEGDERHCSACDFNEGRPTQVEPAPAATVSGNVSTDAVQVVTLQPAKDSASGDTPK